MSRSVVLRLALALAAIAGLPRLSGATDAAARSGARAIAAEPMHVSARALQAWRWRTAQDRLRTAGMDLPGAALLKAPGALQGADQIILNDTTGTLGSTQDQLVIGSYPGRNIVVVWRDTRTGDGDVRAQLFDPSGQPLTAPGRDPGDFVVNDDAMEVDQQRPAVAMNSLGEFVVVWSDGRQGASDIWLQRFAADGSTVGPNVKINVALDDEPKYSHTRPAVALNDSGRAVVVWLDDRTGSSNEVFAARLTRSNKILIAPFQVSGPVGSGDHVLLKPNQSAIPVVAFTGVAGDTSFIVAWQARNLVSLGGNQAIFARYLSVFDSSLGLPATQAVALLDDRACGDTFTVDKSTNGRAASRPVLLAPAAGDTAKAFVVAWVDSTPLCKAGAPAIRARRVSVAAWARGSSPTPDSSFVVSDSAGLGATAPSLARLRDGTLSLGWLSNEGSGTVQAVHERLLSPALAALGPSQRMNSGGGLVRRGFPRSGAFGTDQEPRARLAGWVDQRTGSNTVMLRALGSGAAQDSGLKRDRQPDQVSPYVAYGSSGLGVAVWTDFRNGVTDPDIYAQVLDATGAPVGGNFRVNSDAPGAWQDHPVAAADASGGFTVVWEDARGGDFLLYRRHYSGQPPVPDSLESPVSPLGAGAPADSMQQFRPSIAVSSSGKGVLAWEDNRRWVAGSNMHVFDSYMVALDPSGKPLGTPIAGNDATIQNPNTALIPSLDPTVALDPQGNGFLFWSFAFDSVLKQNNVPILTITIKDVSGRCFRIPTGARDTLRLVSMLDTRGRLIASRAFSVADSLGSAFVFARQRPRAAYVGAQTFLVAFEDERLTTTAKEDIRAQLYRVQALNPDTVVQVYTDGPNFLVNDDTVPLPPDPSGAVYYMSASQFDAWVMPDVANNAFTLMWSDRRTGTNYNIMSQGYHLLPADSLSLPSRLRLLGRNQFVNRDIEIQDAVHGAARGAFSASGQFVAAWQSDRLKAHGYDVYARQLTTAPDTCTNDNCLFSPHVALEAQLAGESVQIGWQVPRGRPGDPILLLRYELQNYRTNPAAQATVLGSFSSAAGSYQAQDHLLSPTDSYMYELMQAGEVLASAVPVPAVVRYSLALAPVTPNPARGLARIAFTVPGKASERVAVSLRLYDVAGRRVRTLVQDVLAAGNRSVTWDGSSEGGAALGTGVYFLRLEAGGRGLVRKVLWLR